MTEEERHDSYCGEKLLYQIDRFRKNISGVMAGEDDPEYLHKSRVALRRMRVIISLMTDVFSDRERKNWNRKFRDLGRVLGKARDLDVKYLFLLNLEEGRDGYGIHRLSLRLKQQRTRVNSELLGALERFNSSALDERITKTMRPLLGIYAMEGRKVSSMHRARPAISTAVRRVAGHDAFVKNGYEREAYHSLRKDCKKLRYILEIYSDSFGGIYEDFIGTVKKLQDLLGDIHDDDLWLELLPQFIEEEKIRTEEYFGHLRGFVKISRDIESLMDLLAVRFKSNKKDFFSLWNELFTDSVWQLQLDRIDERLEGDERDGAS